MRMSRIAATTALANCLRQRSHVLLDRRTIAAYNGWALQQEPRGEHIEGATAFPFEWARNRHWLELLRQKGIMPDGELIVYGYHSDDTEQMAEQLTSEGYTSLSTFNRFRDWSGSGNLPVERLPRYKKLACPDWIRALITGDTPPTCDNTDYVKCHASYRYREDYESGHIPGAIHLDTELLESPRT